MVPRAVASNQAATIATSRAKDQNSMNEVLTVTPLVRRPAIRRRANVDVDDHLPRRQLSRLCHSDVLHADRAIQLANVVKKLPNLMISARQCKDDGYLRVQLLALLRARLDEPNAEAAQLRHPVEVLKKTGDLGVFRKGTTILPIRRFSIGELLRELEVLLLASLGIPNLILKLLLLLLGRLQLTQDTAVDEGVVPGAEEREHAVEMFAYCAPEFDEGLESGSSSPTHPATHCGARIEDGLATMRGMISVARAVDTGEYVKLSDVKGSV